MLHIHVDGTALPLSTDHALEQLGFTKTDFSGHPEGFTHFEPNMHRTLKLTDGPAFKAAWKQAAEILKSGGFIGYLEAEHIAHAWVIPEHPFTDIAAPFKISRRRLLASRGERFRQAELHLTLDKDRSDPRLIRGLLEAGMYGAYMPKQDHTALVLTVQGKTTEIGDLVVRLYAYIMQAGGIVSGRLKWETAIRHLCIGIRTSDLPEIIDRVTYL